MCNNDMYYPQVAEQLILPCMACSPTLRTHDPNNSLINCMFILLAIFNWHLYSLSAQQDT